jgi:eukaryotic-like serine/threonine-protein kinase
MPSADWRVGDYVVDDPAPIGHGSFGTVYRARRAHDGASVALKVVWLTSAADSSDKLAAERHGAMLQERFEHAHGMVPKVYGYGSYNEHFYIAMEFISGGALSDLIRRGPLAPRLAAEHAARMCDFLDKAHQFETTIEGKSYEMIVHADLKPAHVLLPHPGDLKVLDFGIAKALANTRPVTTNNWSTTDYAPPERLDSAQVDGHADFWAVGVMLYEMVSGHRPYSSIESNRSHLERAIRSNTPREPLPSSCPPALAAIVNKLLAYQVERRYPTAAAIKSDLELFLADREPAAIKEYVTQPTTPVQRSLTLPPPLPPAPLVPPTDPIPVGVAGNVVGLEQPPAPARQAMVTRQRFLTRRRLVRVVAGLTVLLVLVGTIAREGAAWVAAERFRGGIDAVDGPTLAEKWLDYRRIREWGVFDLGLCLRVNKLLKPRLVALADATIADYRREDPIVGPLEWRQAHEALQWALELSPDDPVLRAKELDCQAHLTRFAAQRQPRGSELARQTYLAAVRKFRRAASLDSKSFDPYLGISRIATYGLLNVDQAVAAIEEAQRRGYQPGRRERALLGDGYTTRAEKGRRLARTLSGEQRRRELENVAADYGRCIDAFDAIVGFGRAAENLEYCKRHLEMVDRVLTIQSETP